jgi:hypothetical protein
MRLSTHSASVGGASTSVAGRVLGGRRMGSRLHRFAESRSVEERWAPTLDHWLGEASELREATTAEQWQGIDRVALTADGVITIDYKCDEQASGTKNLFIEIVSNDVTGRPGWAYTSQADWLAYFIVPDQVWMFLLPRLRQALAKWRTTYAIRCAVNASYRTRGVCVPRSRAERAVEYIARLDKDDGAFLVPRGRGGR